MVEGATYRSVQKPGVRIRLLEVNSSSEFVLPVASFEVLQNDDPTWDGKVFHECSVQMFQRSFVLEN